MLFDCLYNLCSDNLTDLSDALSADVFHVLSLLADVLLEKGEIKADDIWDIYNRSPRVPQVCSQLMFQYVVILKFCFHSKACISSV